MRLSKRKDGVERLHGCLWLLLAGSGWQVGRLATRMTPQVALLCCIRLRLRIGPQNPIRISPLALVHNPVWVHPLRPDP